MQVKTKTVASWDPQRAGRRKRDLINAARGALGKEMREGIPAPEVIDVPDAIMQRHGRRFRRNLARWGAK